MNKHSAEELYNQTRHKKGYRSFYQIVIKRIIDIIAGLIALPNLYIYSPFSKLSLLIS